MDQQSEGRKNLKFQTLRGKIKMSLPSFSPIKRRSESISIPPSHNLLMKESQLPLTDNQVNIEEYTSVLSLERFDLKNVFEQKYDIMEKLGEGANGVVKKCRAKNSQQHFAVKIGRMQEEHVVALKGIVALMRNITHQNILKMKELYVDIKRSKYYQIIQYLPYPSLKNLLNHHQKFTSASIEKIMKQLLSSLEYFHKHYIVHRDIKTSNLLFDAQKSKLYVIDLGIITKTIQRDKRRNLWTNTGTLEYKAPQMLEGSSYNQSIDMWAAGVVLFELVEGRTPFREQTQMDTIDNIRQVRYKFTPELWVDMPLAKLLVIRLLKPKGQRLTANAALKDPWFQLMDFEYKPPKIVSPLKTVKTMNASSVPTSNAGIMQSEAVKKMDLDEEQQNVFGLSADSKEFLRMTSYESRVKSNIQMKISFDEIQRMLGNQTQKDIINNNN